jgi:hypothetical protein
LARFLPRRADRVAALIPWVGFLILCVSLEREGRQTRSLRLAVHLAGADSSAAEMVVNNIPSEGSGVLSDVDPGVAHSRDADAEMERTAWPRLMAELAILTPAGVRLLELRVEEGDGAGRAGAGAGTGPAVGTSMGAGIRIGGLTHSIAELTRFVTALNLSGSLEGVRLGRAEQDPEDASTVRFMIEGRLRIQPEDARSARELEYPGVKSEDVK